MWSVAAYVLALAVVQATGEPDWTSLASSPARLADGELWVLLTSGLVIDGVPWVQLALLAAVLVLAQRRLGTARMWIVALAAHVGAALVAYAGVGVLWLADPATVAGAVDQPDYGISVLLAGEVGALAATASSRRDGLLVAAVAFAGIAIGLASSSALASVQHVLGFAIGALVPPALARGRPRDHVVRAR